MRKIAVNRITIENFKSFTTPTEIVFSANGGLKFLTGDNQVEPRLGANGAGKSSLWDALCFCLYGTSVKGHRASDLISWGAKQARVAVDLTINDEMLTILRQSSPNKIFLDDSPIEQNDVDRIIGLTRGRFLQAVLFGQAVPLFLDLSLPQRSELLDDILDLGVWLRLAEKAGAESSALEKSLSKLELELAATTARLAALQLSSALLEQSNAWEREHDAEIERLIVAVAEAEEAQASAQETSVRAKARLAELPNISKLQAQIQRAQQDINNAEAEYRTYARDLTAVTAQIEFYQHTSTCEVCGQKIDKAFAKARLAHFENEQRTLKTKIQHNGNSANLAKKILEELRAEHDAASRKREHFVTVVATCEAEQHEKERIVASLVAMVERKAEERNPFEQQIAAHEAERAKAEESQKQLQTKRRHEMAAQLKAEFWRQGFKRVRLFVVKRILAQLEVEVENAASALGLPGWKIKFTTETETKSGTQKQGIQLQVFSPHAQGPWEVWSGGESQRIRIAISIGIASFIQRLAGVSFCFEVWDEPSSWLSPEGIDDLLECLQHRAQITGKSVWITDHRALQHASFTEVWQATKSKEGTKVTNVYIMSS